MTDLLFVKTSSLGDVVHHMPAVTDARLHLPRARIAWVVEEAFAPLVRLHPHVTEVIPVATRRWRRGLLRASTWCEVGRLRMTLRERNVDVTVDTQGLLRSALMARLTDGQRHGYDAQSIREPWASRLYDVTHRVSRDLHAVVRNRTLTGLALGYVPGPLVDYGLMRPSRETRRRPYAVLLHGTSRTAKEWAESEWIGLGRWLRGRGLDVILLWGNEAERQRCVRLGAAIPDAQIFQRQPLDVTANEISGATMVVGVDTGLLHLAAAYAVPLIGLYVETEPGLTGPVGQGPIAILGRKGAPPLLSTVVKTADEMLASA